MDLKTERLAASCISQSIDIIFNTAMRQQGDKIWGSGTDGGEN